MGTRRYYVANTGMLKADELPAGWGLIEVEGGQHGGANPAVRAPAVYRDSDRAEELRALIATVRRSVAGDRNVSCKTYLIPTKQTTTVSVMEPEASGGADG